MEHIPNQNTTNEIVAMAQAKQIERLEQEKDKEIEKAINKVMNTLKGYGLETTNTEYLRLRIFGEKAFNTILTQLKSKHQETLQATEEVTLGGTIPVLADEILYTYFFEEFGLYPIDIAHAPKGPALKEYLEKLRNER